ncbi:MAG TPA: hypothetical protein VE264_06735 [Nitrososphaera sp.]|nr:hypothetical protein [Nitrososphaera sp.]
MVALIAENSFSQVADIVRDQIISFWGVVLFVAISVVYAFGQFFILEIIKAKNREVSGSIGISENVTTIVQYILTSIIVFAILEVLFSSQYHRDLLIASNTISYGAAIFLTVLLTWKLLFWYKIYKRPIVLLYGLAAVFIVLTHISTLIWSDAVLLQKESVVLPESEVLFDPGFEEGSAVSFILSILYYFQTTFILLLWGGTVLLLYHNFKRIGRVKFWILVSLPIVSFMSIFISFYQEIAPISPVTEAISLNFMIPILLLNYSGLAVGVIFGLSFILIGRFLKHGIHSRDYMIVAGFGFMIFMWANGTTLIQAAYPPYGIATVSALPLSLFMILNGLSYSAVSVAQDITLRRSIRKNVKDMKFLESIGTAQMEQELQKRVLTIAKKNSEIMTEETGVQPSLSEDDMKQYLEEVIQEIKVRKA